MSNALTTCEDALAAIQQAERVLVFVHTSTGDNESAGNHREFPIAKELAIAAVIEIYREVAEPNIELSDDGKTVTIGKEHPVSLPENASHFENNNGNF